MSHKKIPPDVKVYRRDALKAARDLNYSPKVIDVVRRAKTIGEIEHIMNSARKGDV